MTPQTLKALLPSARFTPCVGALALAGALLAITPAQAAPYLVTVNTGLLSGKGTFYFNFNLSDGSGVGDGNSQAVISNFTFNGGTLQPVTSMRGGVTDNRPGTLTLQDSDTTNSGFASIIQPFTVSSSASTLQFTLNPSATSVDAGGTDDAFYFQLLDSSQNPLVTNGPNFVELVNADYSSTMPTPVGYTTQSSLPKNFAGADPNYPGITAVVVPAPVPEASTTVSLGLLLLLGAGGCAMSARRRKASA